MSQKLLEKKEIVKYIQELFSYILFYLNVKSSYMKKNNKSYIKSFNLSKKLFFIFLVLIILLIFLLYFLFHENMNTINQQVQLLYLFLLVIFLASSFLYIKVINFGEFLRNLSIWVLIASFLAIIFIVFNLNI